MRCAAVAAAVVAFILAGSVGGAAPEPDEAEAAAPFPSQQELEDLAEREAPPSLFSGDHLDLESWKLRGPFPEEIGEIPIADPGPFERALLDAASARAGLVVASESMRCVAREVGLFGLEHHSVPGPSLRRYILGRCGATGGGMQMGSLTNTTPPDAPPERVFEAWEPEVRRMVEANLGSGPRAAGIWFGRRETHSVTVVVTVGRRVRLDPVSPVPDPDGRIRLRGEALIPLESVDGQINRGRLGFGDCEPAPGVTLPLFDLSCELDTVDRTAWIALSGRPPARILGEGLLNVLARPSGADAAEWSRGSYGAANEVVGPEDFRTRLVAEVNRLRSGAKLADLALESQESLTAARLAPVYFGSSLGMMSSSFADAVALGLMAGWEVGGLVRDASIGSALVLGSRDLDHWLAEALENPATRRVLLHPARTRLAVGPLIGMEAGAPYLAAVVASYALAGGEDAVALRQDLYARLDAEFDRRGMRFPRRERSLEAAAAREVERIENGAVDPGEAIRILMHESSARLQAPVSGFLLGGTGVADLALPEDLFSEEAVHIAAAVGHRRPPGWPWAHTFVLLLTAPDSPTRSARLGSPLR